MSQFVGCHPGLVGLHLVGQLVLYQVTGWQVVPQAVLPSFVVSQLQRANHLAFQLQTEPNSAQEN